MKWSSTFLLAVSMIFFVQTNSLAQTVSPPVATDQSLPTLRSKYLAFIQQYRDQEQRYIRAKSQYQQLQTLASQEEVIRETRQLLTIRADIYATYLDILDEELNQALGIPIEKKNSQRVSISLLNDKVAIHRTNVQTITDRFAMDQEVDRFSASVDELHNTAAATYSMIKIGQMQIAIDKLKLVTAEVRTYVFNQDLPANTAAEKTRGFNEIDRVTAQLEINFKTISDKFYANPNQASISSYNQLTTQLTTPYAELNRVVEFLEEIKQ